MNHMKAKEMLQGGCVMAKEKRERTGNLPIGRNEDVKYAEELADTEDREAQKRADAADKRAVER